MPSLRKRVSSYFRQLSFHNETREKRNSFNDNTFITKYLQGQISLRDGPQIVYGKNPTDLPNYELDKYENGPETVKACYSGPNGGLTTVPRIEKHLSIPDDDIAFIDTHEEETVPIIQKKSPQKVLNHPIDNTTMIIKVAGHEYCVTNKPKRHSKSHSLGSISDFNIEIEKTKIEKSFYSNDSCETNNETPKIGAKNTEELDFNENKCEASASSSSVAVGRRRRSKEVTCDSKNTETKKTANCDKNASNYALSKSKSDGDPFRNKRGRIIKIERPKIRAEETNEDSDHSSVVIDDSSLPNEWNRKTDFCYGLSDSLYDRNQVTRKKNGDPIADCFGVIARRDSAILAVADGVNWGEKASIAAKSAVHGCLHYLSKTIFNDTKPFENLSLKTDESSSSVGGLNPNQSQNLINNTREVFVCLLRAFSCAHDLILENKGMLTTLTVAVVLPLKQRNDNSTTRNGVRRSSTSEMGYVCCVCNVGDTLAYVYSQKYGVRELTKGSHDVTSNRDMRNALGALGPVDGINPELSNLTLSITTLQKGDIIMVASDGLTDNFDPNVCRFAVNSNANTTKPTRNTTHVPDPKKQPTKSGVIPQKVPTKPPRKSKNRTSISSERSTSSSIENDTTTDRSRRDGSSTSRQSEPRSNSISRNAPIESSSNAQASSQPKHDVDYENPLVAQFMRENSIKPVENKKPAVVENKASSLRRQATNQTRQEHKKTTENSSYKFLKSKTSLDLRSSPAKSNILRNDEGIPYVTPIQRYELQLLLMEDVLRNGISGNDSPCICAKKLCENLVNFTMSITSAKRRTLEDHELYFDNRNGVLVEVSTQEKKLRRKKGMERVQNLPGKLDHVTVVAYNVGGYC